jgi:hypothetical protein
MLARTSPPLLLTAEAALGWEFWTRFRRQLPLTLTAMCLLPLLVGLSRRAGQLILWVRFHEWEQRGGALSPQFHLGALMVQIAAVLLVLLAIPPLSRAFLLPLTTRALFRARMWQVTAAACIAMTLSTFVNNVILGTDWPYAAPILFATVAIAAAHWIAVEFRGREWRIGAAGGVVVALLVWRLRSHFYDGSTGVWTEHPFENFHIPEGLALATAFAAISRRTLMAAEWERCAARGMNADEVSRASRVPARPAVPHGFAWTAMLSYEWRRNGTLFPVTVAVAALLGFGLHLGMIIRDMLRSSIGNGGLHLLKEFASGEFILLLGFAVFAYSPLLQVFTMSSGRRVLAGRGLETWPLTLPASNRKIANVALARALLSGLVGAAIWWLIGFSCLIGAQILLRSRGDAALADAMLSSIPSNRFQLAVSVVLASATGWTLAGVVEACVLSGRRWVAALPYTILFGLFVLFAVVEAMFQHQVDESWIWALAACIAVAAFATALLRGELGWRGVAVCLALWIAMVVAIPAAKGWDFRYLPVREQRGISLAELLGSLCVTLPITLPPLAVGWNRSR